MNERINKDLLRLNDILDAISSIESLDLSGTNSRTDFFAAAYLISVIGEAAGRLSESIRTNHTNVPWRDIISMRNRLIHEYGKVNFERVKAVIELDIPILKADITVIRNSIK